MLAQFLRTFDTQTASCFIMSREENALQKKKERKTIHNLLVSHSCDGPLFSSTNVKWDGKKKPEHALRRSEHRVTSTSEMPDPVALRSIFSTPSQAMKDRMANAQTRHWMLPGVLDTERKPESKRYQARLLKRGKTTTHNEEPAIRHCATGGNFCFNPITHTHRLPSEGDKTFSEHPSGPSLQLIDANSAVAETVVRTHGTKWMPHCVSVRM